MLSRSAWDKYKRSFRRQKRRARILGRHPFAVPVFTGLFLILLTFGLLRMFGSAKVIQVTPNSKIVIISHDGIKQVVPTNDKTVGDLLSRLHIAINPGDVVEPNVSTPINQDDFRVNILRAVPVAIAINGQVSYTDSAASTPRAIAEQAGASVSPTDYVTTIPTQNFLQSGAIGQTVVIESGIPINLDLYGTDLSIFVHASTVADLIRAENIHIFPGDKLSPSINSPISPRELVSITGKSEKIQTVTQTIAMPVQTNDVSDLAYGTSSIIQQGSPGQQVVMYEDVTQNGTTTQIPIQTIVTVPAVTQIVDEGDSLTGIQGDMSLAGIPASSSSYVDYIVSHESGWCPTKAQGEHSCPAVPDDAYTSAGYGLCQATPGYKMASAGSDWATDPITQLRWCNGYALSRYGSWYNAYIHWIDNGNW